MPTPPSPPPGTAPAPPTAPPPAAAARRLLVPLGVLAGIAVSFAYVGTVDPNEPGHYPVCPFLRFTGAYCPGCGGLRSAYAVAHGDIPTALGANALAVVGYALFAALWLLWTVRTVRGLPVRVSLGPASWWALGGLILIFTVVRNLPFGSVLAP
ncbi:DUF2752 domain-containing protein [Streptomyces sp. NPDC050504]|uniref:DUF2752 domain-containing protein n=1 Tax=Streptomyces sp. NPDC050504 TaxID=3365618 RepID=UPI00378CB95A